MTPFPFHSRSPQVISVPTVYLVQYFWLPPTSRLFPKSYTCPTVPTECSLIDVYWLTTMCVLIYQWAAAKQHIQLVCTGHCLFCRVTTWHHYSISSCWYSQSKHYRACLLDSYTCTKFSWKQSVCKVISSRRILTKRKYGHHTGLNAWGN